MTVNEIQVAMEPMIEPHTGDSILDVSGDGESFLLWFNSSPISAFINSFQEK
ncbi:hypothetical protein [Peribacillus sp. SCS-155]|uniref:hypothetical protein n=1 Tax=Peribacillus sedimenti TaxID=3115297 RepID=UPI003905AD71